MQNEGDGGLASPTTWEAWRTEKVSKRPQRKHLEKQEENHLPLVSTEWRGHSPVLSEFIFPKSCLLYRAGQNPVPGTEAETGLTQGQRVGDGP